MKSLSADFEVSMKLSKEVIVVFAEVMVVSINGKSL